MAMAVAAFGGAVVRPSSSSSSWRPVRSIIGQRQRASSFSAQSTSSSSSSSASSRRKQLILYSKSGCCLCDGLKEKLHAAFSLSSPPHSLILHDVDLQIRDITTNPEWEKAYQYEIPVLARLRPDGSEEIIPRFSPRVGVELIQKKLAAALSQ